MEQHEQEGPEDQEDLPDVHFGQVGAEPANWREAEPEDDDLDDDKVLTETPSDVITMLGFDPLEDEEGADEDDADDAS